MKVQAFFPRVDSEFSGILFLNARLYAEMPKINVGDQIIFSSAFEVGIGDSVTISGVIESIICEDHRQLVQIDNADVHSQDRTRWNIYPCITKCFTLLSCKPSP